VAFVPVLVLAAESASWVVAGVAAFVSMMVGMLTLLWYLHWVLRAPVIAWAIPVSIASLMLAVGVLLFRGLLRRGAVFPAVISLPLFWTVFEAAVSRVPANGTAGSLAYTQEGFLPILQIASLTGPWGITFLLLLLQTAVASAVYLWRRKLPRARLVVGSAVGVVVMAIVFGMVRLAAPRPSQRILVGLVDTDAVEFADGPELQQLMKEYAGQAAMLAEDRGDAGEDRVAGGSGCAGCGCGDASGGGPDGRDAGDWSPACDGRGEVQSSSDLCSARGSGDV
jgi:apolipoprotein N-acyltransferase